MREQLVHENGRKYRVDNDETLGQVLVSVENEIPVHSIRMIEGKLYYLYDINTQCPPHPPMFEFGFRTSDDYEEVFDPVYKNKHKRKIVGYTCRTKLTSEAERQRREAEQRRIEHEKTYHTCRWIPVTFEMLSESNNINE